MDREQRRLLVERLFHETIDLAVDERAAFLVSRCGADSELLNEIQGLISAAGGVSDCVTSTTTRVSIASEEEAEGISGNSLGHYTIHELLGKGGMGEVYRAIDTRLARDVAIKFVPPEYARDETRLHRLEREARMLASLNHPNLATIHGLEYIGDSRFLVMELVPGETLGQRMARERIPMRESLLIFSQIAEALEAAHAKGVIHRDLKPVNIKLTPEGKVKVLDFGLAKSTAMETGVQKAHSLSEPGTAMGTPAYMSPEQARGESVDARTDIWAFGVLMYEVLTGGRPFNGGSVAEIFGNVLHGRPDWTRLPADTPAALRAILQACLEKYAGARPHHTSKLVAAIRTAVADPLRAVQLSMSTTALQWDYRRGLRRLAVLPLQNLSGDPEQDFFVDGTHDALITELARLGALRVIARNSVIRYQSTQKPLTEIGKELNVDVVMTGSVGRSGDHIRITAQLISTETEEHLWAGRYDRNLRDVLSLQNEIVAAIAREIQLQLSPEEEAQLANARPINPEAYEAYLRGRFQWYKLSRDHLDTALGYFQLALEKDPNCALAHAGIAAVWCALGDTGAIPPDEAFSKGRAAASKAAGLNDTLAEVHATLGNVKFCHEWDWREANIEFSRAIDLNPNYADAHLFYADFLISLKRFEEAMSEIQLALDLDPLNYFSRCFFGWHLVYAGRYDDAIAELRQTLSREPNFAAAHLGLWGAFYQARMYEDALEAAKKFFAVLDDTEIEGSLREGAGKAGYRGAMGLAASRLEERARHKYVPAIRVARLYAHAGETERTLEWLERAFEKREPPLVHLSVGWDWRDLRDHPDFQVLLRRINLPD